MVQCFAADCNHNSEREECAMFRFPWTNNKTLKKWIDLCRRHDTYPTKSSRLCNCHFKRVDGLREELPSIFNYNKEKHFNFESPEKRPKRESKKSAASDVIESSEQGKSEPEPIESTSERAVKHLEAEKICLQFEINGLKSKVSSLEKELLRKTTKFGYNNIEDDDTLVSHYTGLPSSEMFQIVLSFCTRIPFQYYEGWKVQCLNNQDQLLICLMKLRRNLSHVDLSVRFGVGESTVKNIVLTWLHVLHEVLFVGILQSRGMPSQAKNFTSLPQCFSSFTNCRVIYDCTEIQTAVPRQSMAAQSHTFSHYKQRNTLKGLVGVAPNGTVTFVSDLYPGSLSDKEIVRHSNALDQLKPGDMILADKGFLVQDMLPKGVTLNIPPFLSSAQFTQEQVILTTRIARARIHVERAMEKNKELYDFKFYSCTL